MRKINTLVVGQGIAGTLAAYMLLQKNISFVVMDPCLDNTSSLIAAGMFTPVSGKRKTIAPLILEQIPFAINIYRQLESLLGIKMLHLKNIYHVFASAEERDEMILKLEKGDHKELFFPGPSILPNLKQAFGAMEITASGWVDCACLVQAFRKLLVQNDAWLEGHFDHQKFTPGNEEMQYGQLQFKNIIFCEGYRGIDNPYFGEEKIIPCKGDVLTINADVTFSDHIIKKTGIYLVELNNKLFRVGATYRWHNKSEEADTAGKEELEIKLDDMLENPFTVLEHKAGIRPTTQTREVIAKQHAGYKNMFMLNGFGTKGIIQGPWFAHELIEKYFS